MFQCYDVKWMSSGMSLNLLPIFYALKPGLPYPWILPLIIKTYFVFLQFNKAYKLLLELQKFNHKEAFIEKAKLLWARDNQVRLHLIFSGAYKAQILNSHKCG